MKLLFDQNLSPKLVARLADLFPGSSHVQMAGLDRADDDQVWEYARLNGYAIVTKDEDYYKSQRVARLSAESDLVATGELYNGSSRSGLLRSSRRY